MFTNLFTRTPVAQSQPENQETLTLVEPSRVSLFSSERLNVLCIAGMAAAAIIISQFAGALFIHVANLELRLRPYAMSLGTEKLMYLGSAGLMIGGGVVGALIYILATQAIKKAMEYGNEHELEANLHNKDFNHIEMKTA